MTTPKTDEEILNSEGVWTYGVEITGKGSLTERIRNVLSKARASERQLIIAELRECIKYNIDFAWGITPFKWSTFMNRMANLEKKLSEIEVRTK